MAPTGIFVGIVPLKPRNSFRLEPSRISFGICNFWRFFLRDSSLFSLVGVYSDYSFLGNYIFTRWDLLYSPFLGDLHTFLYIQKAKTIAKSFYIQNAWHFSKSRTISVRFYISKARHFTLRGLSWSFWTWHLYTKSMTLCITWRFYIQKSRQFSKSKTICVTFLYTKIWTLCVTRFFIGFFKLAKGGGIFKIKTMHLVLYFYMQKTMYFALHFTYKKPDTMRHILYAKKNALCGTFLYLKFILWYWYLSINARTIRVIRSKNKIKLFIENWYYSYDKLINFDTYQIMRA